MVLMLAMMALKWSMMMTITQALSMTLVLAILIIITGVVDIIAVVGGNDVMTKTLVLVMMIMILVLKLMTLVITNTLKSNHGCLSPCYSSHY